MGKLFLFLLIAAAAVVALKVALIFACLICLIFKPKETLALLFAVGVLALVRNYTLFCVVVGVLIVGFGMYQHRRSSLTPRP